MSDEIADREAYSRSTLDAFQEKIKEIPSLVHGKACVYATGSFGRLEAVQGSDLDLFIVGNETRDLDDNGKPSRSLSRLDEICAKSQLIHASRQLGLPDFDGDGRFLNYHRVFDLVQNIGSMRDDVDNTLTARLLLFLESKCLVGHDVYSSILAELAAAYWRDYQDHRQNFEPAYFLNDVLRLWRTFCVNYEANTRSNSPEELAKRRAKLYKLRHSRMITCYSAILYILFIFEKRGTVSPADMIEMVNLSPLQRIADIGRQHSAGEVVELMSNIRTRYGAYLEVAKAGEAALRLRFSDDCDHRNLMDQSREFGDCLAKAVLKIAPGKRLQRIVLV